MKTRSTIVLSLALLLGLAAAVTAQTEDEKTAYVRQAGLFRKPGNEIKTFTIPVAKPFAGAAPKVLFLPRLFRERDVVDVTNSFDMEWDSNWLIRANEFGRLLQTKGTMMYEPAVALLREKLAAAKYDAIVMANSASRGAAWVALPEDVRNQICDLVKGGTALIYAGRSAEFVSDMTARGVALKDSEYAITNRVLFQDTRLSCRAWNTDGGETRWSEGTLGAGRVIAYDFSGWGKAKAVCFTVSLDMIRDGRAEDAVWTKTIESPELIQAFGIRGLGNLIYHATGRLPQQAIKIAGASEPAPAGKARKLSIDLASCGAGAAAVELVVYDVLSRVVWTHRVDVSQASEPVSTPAMPAGEFWLTARSFDSQGRVLNWSANALIQQGDATVTATLDRAVGYKPGENIDVAIDSANLPAGDAAFHVQAWDQHGRLVHDATLPAKEGKAQASIATQDALSHLMTIEVIAMAGGAPLAATRVEAQVQIERYLPFPVIMYGAHPEQARKQLGVTGLYHTQRGSTIFDMEPSVWGALVPGIQPDPVPKAGDLIRNASLMDPAFRKASIDLLASYAKNDNVYGNRGLLWVDEWSYAGHNNDENDLDHSPHSLAGLRAYLKEVYSSVNSLNQAWGATFASWDEVTPPLVADVKKEPRRWATAWSDHRSYADREVADYFRFLNEEYRKLYPKGRTGLSGTRDPNAYNGMDWWLVMQSNDYISTYGGAQELLARSFRRPGMTLARWFGYNHGGFFPDKARGAWPLLLQGYTEASDYAVQEYSHFYGDYAPRPATPIMAEVLRTLNDGVGHALREATVEDDGIAIHYSQKSVQAARLLRYESRPFEERHYNDNIMSTALALQHQGFGCRAIAYAQIERGDLAGKDRPRLLILPMSQALSDKEVTEIRKYVASGGVVVADSMVGVRDGHTAPLPKGSLDDLFGVDQSNLVFSGDAGVVTLDKIAIKGKAAETITFAARNGSSGLKVTTGKPWGVIKAGSAETPAAVVNRVGKGAAVYLNFVINDYTSYEPAGVGGEESIIRAAKAERQLAIGRALVAVTKLADIQPGFTVSENGQPTTAIVRYPFVNGKVKYVGLLRSRTTSTEEPPFTVTLAKAAEVYEITSRKYLGKTDRAELTMPQSNAARVLAISEKKLGALSVDGPANAKPGETMNITVQRASGDVAGYALIEVLDPGGAELTHFHQVIKLDNNRGTVRVPVAFNEPAGKWTIRATDVFSGLVGEGSVVVGLLQDVF